MTRHVPPTVNYSIGGSIRGSRDPAVVRYANKDRNLRHQETVRSIRIDAFLCLSPTKSNRPINLVILVNRRGTPSIFGRTKFYFRLYKLLNHASIERAIVKASTRDRKMKFRENDLRNVM